LDNDVEWCNALPLIAPYVLTRSGSKVARRFYRVHRT
jgi:hypothetical protein